MKGHTEKARTQPKPGETGSEPWYVAEGKRGEQLLHQGHVGQATEISNPFSPASVTRQATAGP